MVISAVEHRETAATILPVYVAAAVTVAAALSAPLRASHSDRLHWQPFSSAALDEARNRVNPVFVDFTAAWCLSCQVNEKSVLERTRYDPEITAALRRVGRSGVPTYVVLSGSSDGSLHVLPEFLTRNVVLNAIRQTGS